MGIPGEDFGGDEGRAAVEGVDVFTLGRRRRGISSSSVGGATTGATAVKGATENNPEELGPPVSTCIEKDQSHAPFQPKRPVPHH